MPMVPVLRIAFVLIMVSGLSIGCDNSEPDPIRRKSPTAIASITHGNTYVKIVYGQPYKNGRSIFGDLIPYGKVWRTGANEATELTTTKPIWIKGEKLEQGTYSIFSIPRKNSWTIILNSALGQWGAFDYDQTKDILRIEVPVIQLTNISEVFTIRFDEHQGNATNIIIRWDNVAVRIPLSFAKPSVRNS